MVSKFLCKLLVTALMIILLVGCSSADPNDGNNGDDSPDFTRLSEDIDLLLDARVIKTYIESSYFSTVEKRVLIELIITEVSKFEEVGSLPTLGETQKDSAFSFEFYDAANEKIAVIDFYDNFLIYKNVKYATTDEWAYMKLLNFAEGYFPPHIN